METETEPTSTWHRFVAIFAIITLFILVITLAWHYSPVKMCENQSLIKNIYFSLELLGAGNNTIVTEMEMISNHVQGTPRDSSQTEWATMNDTIVDYECSPGIRCTMDNVTNFTFTYGQSTCP